MVALDFFAVPIVTYKVLFVLVILAHERLIGSIRREVLDQVIVLNEGQLRCLLQSYLVRLGSVPWPHAVPGQAQPQEHDQQEGAE